MKRRRSGAPSLYAINGGKLEAERAQTDAIAQARDMYTSVEGRRAAAWMAMRHRRQLHDKGAVAFTIAAGTKLPKWVSYAMAGFRSRDHAWAVLVVDRDDGSKAYVVTWKGWHTHGRHRDEQARRQRNRRKRGRSLRAVPGRPARG